MLCQQSDEVLFGHLVTTLNAIFESKLTLEDKGYDSSSENFNIPTPLRRISKIQHISSEEHASFDPDPVTPCSTGIRESHYRLVCRCLTFSSSEEDDDNTPVDKTPSPNSTPPVQYHTDPFQHSLSKCTLNAYVTLESRRRGCGRGFPNTTPWWWILGYGRDPWQTLMYSWTCLTTWTLPIPVSICKLPDIVILWLTGFKQHLRIQGYNDHIQQWRHPSTQDIGYYKRTEVWIEHLYS